MRKSAPVLTVLGCLGVSAVAGDCVYSLQVLQLQDASGSFEDDVVAMESMTQDIVSNITTAYPGSMYGISSFIDKPVVLHGYGPYGGWGGYAPDFCFFQNIDFTTDTVALSKALADLAATVGSGFDDQENQLEALLYAAQKIGWAPPDQIYDDQGRPVARIVILITDAPPHLEGDYYGSTTNMWNYKHTYTPNDTTGTSAGGMGCDNFASDYGAINVKEYSAEYNELAQLFHLKDFDIAFDDDQQSRWDYLIGLLGPEKWREDFITPHPGTVDQDCGFVEYPSVETVGTILRKYNIYPVFLLADGPGDQYMISACQAFGINDISQPGAVKQCLVDLYQTYINSWGLPGYVGALEGNSSNVVDQIMTAIHSIVNEACLESTPAPPAPVVTTASADDSTTSGGGGAAPVPIPAADGGGVPIPAIAGASAGAVAAIAAGYLGYRAWGGAFAGKPKGADDLAGEVDVPDTQVERETIEEVTMDMFQ